MTDVEFDRECDAALSAVEASLRREACDSIATIVRLVYGNRIELKAIVQEGETPESFEVLHQFGRLLASQGVKLPLAVFVSAEAMTEARERCVFVSGCTVDGRRNGAVVLLTGHPLLRPAGRIVHGCKGARFEGPTSAAELLRGLSCSHSG